MPDTDYALLLEAVDKVTADLAKGLLDGAGIPSYVHGPDFDVAELGSAAHDMLRGVNVFVPPATLERARSLLDEAWGKDRDKE